MAAGFRSESFSRLASLEANNFWFCGRNRIIHWAIHRFSYQMSSFLEIGCGTGFVLSMISRSFPKAQVYGIEFFEEGLSFAQKRVPAAKLLRIDAQYLPFDAEFDAIGIFDVLEHVNNDRIVLSQINKALKPGGILFVTVPQHRWMWSNVDEYACHVRRYDPEEIHTKICSENFQILKTSSFVSILLPIMYLSRFLPRNRSQTSNDHGVEAGFHLPYFLNRLFELILSFELLFIRCGGSFPFGGSRLIIARKPLSPEE